MTYWPSCSSLNSPGCSPAGAFALAIASAWNVLSQIGHGSFLPHVCFSLTLVWRPCRPLIPPWPSWSPLPCVQFPFSHSTYHLSNSYAIYEVPMLTLKFKFQRAGHFIMFIDVCSQGFLAHSKTSIKSYWMDKWLSDLRDSYPHSRLVLASWEASKG